ncbi:MAG: alpha/beta hydrolase [Candidatus Liptonbacteria bacterium]
MIKRVFIIHGWDGYPEEGWFPWLKQELEKVGFEAFVPQMPDPATPRIKNWVLALASTVGQVDENTYFVGHSMGCQAIVRYLETLPDGIKIGGAVFVAGYLRELSNLEDESEVRNIAQEWLNTSLNLEKVRSRLARGVAIFSDDDPYVPLSNKEEFRDKLNCMIIEEHGQKHFSGRTGTTELPAALSAILYVSSG